MYDLAELIINLHGPIPHFCLFGTIAVCLSWWTRELRATIIFMVILSVAGETLQLAWPHLYGFSWYDIMWNVIGSVSGMFVAQVVRFLTSDLWFRREKDWDRIKGEVSGNYT